MGTDTEATSTPEAGKTFATLKRGRVYFLREKEFEYNVPKEVTEEEREWLEEHAVDQISIEDEQEFQLRPKFEFSDTAEPKAAPAPRRRGR